MAEKRLFKELKQLVRNHPLAANNQIVELAPVDEETSIFRWKAVIAKPKKDDNPYYYNGEWTLDIVADASYPIKPPMIKFSRETPINHPNVNIDTGEICLDILKNDSWSPAWNLEHLVLAILMLIDNPEPDSPLNVDLANLFRSDKEAFESVVQYTIWKTNTMYEGQRDVSGVKSWAILAYQYSSEEEDHDSETEERERERERQEKLSRVLSRVQSRAQSRAQSRVQSRSHSRAHSRAPSPGPGELEPSAHLMETIDSIASAKELQAHVSVVQSVGEVVKRELSEKAIEVEASSPTNAQSSASQMQAAHERVRENVTKQVDEICSSASNLASSLLPPRIEREEDKADMEEVKAQFLRQVDEQVHEIRNLRERTVVE